MPEYRTESARGLLRHACVLSILAFASHFLWENAQCEMFFVHGSYDATWLGMTMAALGDVGLTWAIYTSVALFSRRWRWTGTPWSWTQIGVLVLAAVALGVAIEIRALETGRWSYNESMPVLPLVGIGIVPLMQLVFLSPLLCALAERLAPSVDKPSLTEATRLRYERIAPIYDAFEWLMELRFRSWRKELWSEVEGKTILELGIGTGKNIPFHPEGRSIAGIDISERMLDRARARSTKLGLKLRLAVADAQALGSAALKVIHPPL